MSTTQAHRPLTAGTAQAQAQQRGSTSTVKAGPRVQPAAAPARLWECTELPLWVRVGVYGIEHHGHRLRLGELRETLGPTTAKDISRAITRAVGAGLLAYDSSARCLYARVKP